jgi:hypothetical protein
MINFIRFTFINVCGYTFNRKIHSFLLKGILVLIGGFFVFIILDILSFIPHMHCEPTHGYPLTRTDVYISPEERAS